MSEPKRCPRCGADVEPTDIPGLYDCATCPMTDITTNQATRNGGQT